VLVEKWGVNRGILECDSLSPIFIDKDGDSATIDQAEQYSYPVFQIGDLPDDPLDGCFTLIIIPSDPADPDTGPDF